MSNNLASASKPGAQGNAGTQADIIARISLAAWNFFLGNSHKLIPYVLVAVFLGVLHLHAMEPYYDASSVLGPGGTSPDATQRLPGSGLSALAGLTVGAVKLTPYDEFQQVLISNELARSLSQNELVLGVLFPDRRETATHSWKSSSSVLSSIKLVIYSWLNWPEPGAPDVASIRLALAKRLHVTREVKSNVLTVTFRANSSAEARDALAVILAEADRLVRVRFSSAATKFSNYILARLQNVSSVDQRAALNSLLIEYQRMEILAGVGLPFSVSVIDPPMAPAMPAGPHPEMVLLMWGGLGLCIGIIFVAFGNHCRERLHRAWLSLGAIFDSNWSPRN